MLSPTNFLRRHACFFGLCNDTRFTGVIETFICVKVLLLSSDYMARSIKYIEAENVLPDNYDGSLLMTDNVELINEPLKHLDVGKDEALLIYWPEAFLQTEFDYLCNNDRFKKIIGCNGDGRNMVEYNGPGNIIKTESGVLSYDLPAFFENNWDELGLDGIKMCFLYERDLAMAPFYSDVYRLNLTDGDVETTLSTYQDNLMHFLDNNVFKTSEKVSDIFCSHGIDLVVLEDLHDFVSFSWDKTNDVEFRNPTLDVGLTGLGQGNPFEKSKVLFDRLYNTSKKTFSSVEIAGVRNSPTSTYYRPHLIMSQHMDVRNLYSNPSENTIIEQKNTVSG